MLSGTTINQNVDHMQKTFLQKIGGITFTLNQVFISSGNSGDSVTNLIKIRSHYKINNRHHIIVLPKFHQLALTLDW